MGIVLIITVLRGVSEPHSELPPRMFDALPANDAARPRVIELRDNAARDWAPQVDFEVTGTWRALSIAVNHQVVTRNFDDAQVVLSASFEL